MTKDEAIAFIHSVTWKGSRPGLSRTKELLGMLGNPQQGLQFIHVAGTNGKGSVSAMLESVLRAAGYRTGLFVSPYIKTFNERIRYCGAYISDEDLAAATAEVKPFAEQMADAPTEFELITAIGFCYFRKKGCDIVVLETGMGGRLDSTNVIEHPLLTLITGISLDHTAFLGSTEEEIAGEKAGIIKKGTPMLFGGHHAGARRVIAAAAEKMGVPFVAAEDVPAKQVRFSLDGLTLTRGEHENIHIPLMGLYQEQNLSTVLAAVDLLKERGLSISEEALRKGLATVKWQGRFEKLRENPLIISDGAHNPEGVAAAAESIRYYFGGKKVLLLTGVMADKDHLGMIRTLAPLTAKAFTVTPDNPRALDAMCFAKEFREAGVAAEGFSTVRAAVKAAVAAGKEQKIPLISLGSLYMYEEVTDVMEEEGILPSDFSKKA